MHIEKEYEGLDKEALLIILTETERLANAGGWEWDILKDIWTFSDNWLHIHGCTERHLSTSELLLIVHPDDRARIQKAFDRAVSEGEDYEIEYRIIKKNTGEERHIRAFGKAKFDKRDVPVKIYGSAQNITAQKLAEKALNKERELFRIIVDRLPLMITRYDPDADMFFFNSEFEKKVGWSTKDVQDIDMMKEVYPDPEYREQAYKYMKKAGREWKEFQITCKSGQIIESEWSSIKFEDGTQVGIGIDITESKNIRKALEKSESLFRGLYDNMTSGSAVYEVLNDGSKGSDYTIKNFNKKSLEIEGKTLDQVVGKSLFDLRPNIDDYGLIPVMKKVWETGVPEYFPIKIYQDEIFSNYYENYIFKIPTGEVITIYNDVTDEKNSEVALKKSEERFALAMEFANDGLWDWKLKTNEIYYSPGWKKMLGYEDQEIPNLFSEWERLTKPEDVESSWAMLNEVIEGKRDRFEKEFQMIHKNGHYVDVLSRANVLFDERGKADRVVGTHIDITERKIFEKEIIQQKQNAERYLNLAGVMFIGLDLDGNVNLTNRQACKILECEKSEIIHKNWFDNFIPLNFRDNVRNVFRQLVAGKIKPVEYYENPVVTKSGKEKIIAWHNTFISDDNDNIIGILGSGEDITDKKILESQLQKAQKMESIGNLAGGIAHDFNNLLFPIIGMSEILLEDLPPDSPEYENAVEILKAGKRGSDLVKQILAFSRQSDYKKIPVRVQHVLKDALKLCRATIPSDIVISYDTQKDCGMIMADQTQIHQVVMNLVTNAYHALDKTGGQITVELRETVLDADDLIGKPLKPGKYAMLKVTDNGCGIEPDIADKIFEPYFTTKEKGKGTGLGLAVVYGIVSEHGGDILMDSIVGKGTAFTLYFPLKYQSSKLDYSQETETLPRGNERILAVDDEGPIVRLIKQMLERLGYNVETRTSSIDALDAFRANPDSFDIVITDMTMPNMTGDELSRELISIKPELPVIICTGFSERLDENKAISIGIKGFLMKPVVRSEIAQTVRKVLDEAKC